MGIRLSQSSSYVSNKARELRKTTRTLWSPDLLMNLYIWGTGISKKFISDSPLLVRASRTNGNHRDGLIYFVGGVGALGK